MRKKKSMFHEDLGNSSIETITLPDILKYLKTDLGRNGFLKCSECGNSLIPIIITFQKKYVVFWWGYVVSGYYSYSKT